MHLNNFAGITEPPNHKLTLQTVAHPFSMLLHTFIHQYDQCEHNL